MKRIESHAPEDKLARDNVKQLGACAQWLRARNENECHRAAGEFIESGLHDAMGPNDPGLALTHKKFISALELLWKPSEKPNDVTPAPSPQSEDDSVRVQRKASCTNP